MVEYLGNASGRPAGWPAVVGLATLAPQIAAAAATAAVAAAAAAIGEATMAELGQKSGQKPDYVDPRAPRLIAQRTLRLTSSTH